MDLPNMAPRVFSLFAEYMMSFILRNNGVDLIINCYTYFICRLKMTMFWWVTFLPPLRCL